MLYKRKHYRKHSVGWCAACRHRRKIFKRTGVVCCDNTTQKIVRDNFSLKVIRMKILYKTVVIKNTARIKDEAWRSIFNPTKCNQITASAHTTVLMSSSHYIVSAIAPMKAKLIINKKKMRFTCRTVSATEEPVRPPCAQYQCAVRRVVHDCALSLSSFRDSSCCHLTGRANEGQH